MSKSYYKNGREGNAEEYEKSLYGEREHAKPVTAPSSIPIKRRRLPENWNASFATRFRPGQSGNPNGRPKGTKNVRKAVEEIFTGKLTIREGNKSRRVTKIEAVLLTQLSQALKGNQRAVQAVVATVKELGLLDARPDKLVVGNLSSFTDEELAEFQRLLEKSSARRVPQ